MMESLQSSVVSLCVHMHVHTRGRKVGEKVMVVVGVWGVGWGAVHWTIKPRVKKLHMINLPQSVLWHIAGNGFNVCFYLIFIHFLRTQLIFAEKAGASPGSLHSHPRGTLSKQPFAVASTPTANFQFLTQLPSYRAYLQTLRWSHAASGRYAGHNLDCISEIWLCVFGDFRLRSQITNYVVNWNTDTFLATCDSVKNYNCTFSLDWIEHVTCIHVSHVKKINKCD